MPLIVSDTENTTGNKGAGGTIRIEVPSWIKTRDVAVHVCGHKPHIERCYMIIFVFPK